MGKEQVGGLVRPCGGGRLAGYGKRRDMGRDGIWTEKERALFKRSDLRETASGETGLRKTDLRKADLEETAPGGSALKKAGKRRAWARDIVCPALLLLLPLRHIAQGIDISDTGYNLACFRWFGELDGMWVYVTYLANAAGKLFTKLPFGSRMIGMNLYCSLVVSLTALCAWYFLKDKIPAAFVISGELLAVCLCWCPHVILYNYLTYLALLIGTVLLYRGIFTREMRCYVLAGAVLGLGVGVRFSNLTHMSLILALWYYGFLAKRKLGEIVKDTLLCVLGYAAGIASFLCLIERQYGLSGYVSMLSGLQTMSDGAKGYSMKEMIAGAFLDYLGSMKWGLLFLLYLLAGLLLFQIRKGYCERGKKLLFSLGFIVLLRFVYGRGMFGLDYHTYFSIFWWVSLFNVSALLCSLIVLVKKNMEKEERLLGAFVAITILILPLGSNNRSYPVINDLFLIAPATLFFLRRLLPRSFPVKLTAAGCLLTLAVQSAGFGTAFVFRDGSASEKRDTKVENNGILKGMYTTGTNAEALEGVTAFWEKAGLSGSSVILYGNIPGISYLLDAPPAITSTWANLESYNMGFWEADFARVEADLERDRPVVMIGKEYEPTDGKAALLQEFMERHAYRLLYENEKLALYH